MAEARPRSQARLFWWTLGTLAALLAALILFSIGGPDSPFSYVVR